MTLTWPLAAATYSGVAPSFSALRKYDNRSASDNPFNNSFMTSTWPLAAAILKGVTPFLSALRKYDSRSAYDNPFNNIFMTLGSYG